MSISALYGETEDEVQSAMCGDQVRVRIRGVEEEGMTAARSTLLFLLIVFRYLAWICFVRTKETSPLREHIRSANSSP